MLLLLAHLYFGAANAESVETLLNEANGNYTILRGTIITAFVSSPSGRGTLNILWSCILTIVACVYTAVHIHVLPFETSRWRRISAKLRWTATALLAPEIVLHSACCQYQEARSLNKTLNKLREERLASARSGDGSEIPPRFSMTYAFLVVMGGMAINTKGLHHTYSQVTLTTYGVELLARNGRFVNISDDQIMDHSKANFLAKILVCVQVSWTVIQCIARGVYHLPLALLEIHTVVHVACALCVYILWWRKPLDIEYAIVIDDSEFRDLTALMLMGSGCLSYDYETGFKYRDLQTLAEFYKLWAKTELKTSQSEEQFARRPDSGTADFPEIDAVFPGRRLESAYAESRGFDDIDRARWKLCGQALVRCSKGGFIPSEANMQAWDAPPLEGLLQSVAKHCRDQIFHENAFRLLFDDAEQATKNRTSSLIFVVLPLLYGGLHLIAWSFEFPSHVELLLWRISAFVVMFGIPLAVAFSILQDTYSKPKYHGHWLQDILHWGLIVLLWISLPSWLLSRTYLVVESFISLRHVPLGVFATPSWLQSIPHI